MAPRPDAAALGAPALASILAGAQDGIAVFDDHLRFIYTNPAACRLLGRTSTQLRGTDLLAGFPIREHPAVLERFVTRLSDTATTFTSVLQDAENNEREIACVTFAIDIGGHRHGVVVFWDLSGPRDAARTAAALAQNAAQLVGTGTTSETLTLIARHAVDSTRALSCGISVVGEDHRLASAGAYGPAGPGYGTANPAWIALADTPVETVIEAMTAGSIDFAEPAGATTVVVDARTRWEQNPITQPFAANLRPMDWQTGVYVPLAWERRVIGFVAVFLPTGLAGPSEAELAFYSALADQAAVAVLTARLATQAARAAALEERGRLARELHDSVSQGLFSMTMHARAAQLSMDRAGIDADAPLGRSVNQLADLTRGALAEMRALIFELRPGALAEDGLVSAVRKHSEALAAREQLAIAVRGPDERLAVTPAVEEHIYRIVLEALYNVVKHARATAVSVDIAVSADQVGVRVVDDGVGFDPSQRRAGHLGLSTMSDRAATVGGALSIRSTPLRGTEVLLTLPVSLPAE